MPDRSIRIGLLKPLRWVPAIAAWSLMMCVGAPAQAQDPVPSVSVGAGLRTSFVHRDVDDGSDSTDNFLLDSARLYLSGPVMKNVTFMFNTEYNGGTNHIGVMDAAARIAFSSKANVWVGRFLPPSDRSNLYGPYYAHHWNVYQDGVQDGYPFVADDFTSPGRANGVMYWGQFGKVFKLSAGVFDGESLEIGGAGDNLLGAARMQFDFWDSEDGYYLNSTYYGDKNILAFGVAGQIQGEDNTAYSVDFLLERKVDMGGAFTIEAEWARYSRLGGYPSPAGPYDTNDGGYVLGSFLFPAMSGPGRFEILGKYAQARFLASVNPDETQKTSEFNLNYVLKQFNARLMMFYQDTRFDVAPEANGWKAGAGLQFQM